MSIITPRIAYKINGNFEYETAEILCEKQQGVHWLKSEIPMGSDIKNWHKDLTESEKHVIGKVLVGFTQAETIVEEYWSSMVSKWFPKPEIKNMAITFASMETIHAQSYSMLNTELGLDNFEAFLEDETTSAKLESLMEVKSNSLIRKNYEDVETHERLTWLRDVARSLAIFSAFTEGVNLFSSFAILKNFSRRNLMKGVGQVVAFSVRDESLHSTGGCWLYRQMIKELPEIANEAFEETIYEAARLSLKLELDFIDDAYSMGAVEGLPKETLQNYIKFRTNTKLQDILLSPIFEVDTELIKDMEWFTSLSAGVEFQDFFAGRVTEYAKGQQNWDSNYVFNSKS